jgi:hypothetical protein
MQLLRLLEADQLGVLFWKIGYAIWHLAELEDAAASFYVVRLHPVQGVGLEAAKPIDDKAKKRTLGQLVRVLLAEGVFEEDFAAELLRLIKERNWLVHHSKREHRGILNRPEEYEALCHRVDRLAEDALAAQKRLAAVFEQYVRSKGVSAEVIAVEAARTRRSWGYE